MLVGIALIVYGLLYGYFLMSMAYGGFLKSPISWRITGFGAVATLFFCGAAFISCGACRFVHRRSSG